MRLSQRRAAEGCLMVTPLMLGCFVFYLAPFILVVMQSLSWGIGYTQRFGGWENYRQILQNEMFRLAAWNTARFLLVALPAILILSFAIALMLRKFTNQHKFLKSALLLPYIMPVVGTVLMIDVVFAESGLINQGLSAVGLPIVDWLQGGEAFGVVVALYLWKNTGYSVIMLLAGLVTIDDDQYGVADLDGASAWQKFIHITLPQMWYSIFFAAVFSLINAFKCFRDIFLIGGIHPNRSIYMLQHFINNAFQNMNYSKLAVSSALMFTVVAILFALCYRFVIRKEAYKE